MYFKDQAAASELINMQLPAVSESVVPHNPDSIISSFFCDCCAAYRIMNADRKCVRRLFPELFQNFSNPLPVCTQAAAPVRLTAQIIIKPAGTQDGHMYAAD